MLVCCTLQGGLEVGAAITLSDLIQALQGGEAEAGSAWQHMAAHLKRIAGAKPVRTLNPIVQLLHCACNFSVATHIHV